LISPPARGLRFEETVYGFYFFFFEALFGLVFAAAGGFAAAEGNLVGC
jgi:hypothetical protein